MILSNNLERSLNRRRSMTSTITQAIQQSPQEMHTLLETISQLYQTGKIPRFWDVLANLSGADRGFGNDWFFTALELERQLTEETKSNMESEVK